MSDTPERYVRSRTIPVAPAAIFEVLIDPTRHPALQPADGEGPERRPPTVLSAPGDTRVAAVGDVFPMNMYIARWDRPYVIHNRVDVFEPDRAIGWWPGGLDEDGGFEPNGWWWRYELEPVDDRTRVTMTYDWTGASQEFRDMVGGLPLFPPEYLDECLAALERTAG